jgi:hypothetical protein
MNLLVERRGQKRNTFLVARIWPRSICLAASSVEIVSGTGHENNLFFGWTLTNVNELAKAGNL